MRHHPMPATTKCRPTTLLRPAQISFHEFVTWYNIFMDTYHSTCTQIKPLGLG